MGLKASIDIGTNSTRLLIADVKDDANLVLIEHHERLTKLGHGLSDDAVLDTEAMQRVIAALHEFCDVISSYEIDDIRAFATSATRDAQNRDIFLQNIKSETGISVRLLSGDEEANLSCLGVMSDFHRQDFVVCDVGGGSTEFINVHNRDLQNATSLDIGSRRLTRQFLHNDPPRSDEIKALRQFARHTMETSLHGFASKRHLVAVGGTSAALALMDAELSIRESYRAHHYRLSSFGLEKIILSLMEKTVEERKNITGLHPKRADVTLGGALIFAEILKFVECEELIVSLRDLMFGVFLE